MNQDYLTKTKMAHPSSLCPSVYYVLNNTVFIGVALFGVLCGVFALITIPKLKLGSCPSILLFILALVDLLILALQVPQMLILERTYESLDDTDSYSAMWYSKSYSRRLRLTLYLFEGWMIICLTLNRFIFVRWPYYDGKYMTARCAIASVLSLALFTVILEAPAFGKIVMSQIADKHASNGNNYTISTTENPLSTQMDYITTATNIRDNDTHFSTIEDFTSKFTQKDILSTIDTTSSETTMPPTDPTTTAEFTTNMAFTSTQATESTVTIETTTKVVTEEVTTATESVTTDSVTTIDTNPVTISSTDSQTTESDDRTSTSYIESTVDTDSNTTDDYDTGIAADIRPKSAAIMFKEIRDTYVEVLDRFVTTLAPIIFVIPFLITMAVMLPGGHPRMCSLSHEVIMERSAVVIMLTGVTWYVVANLPYQIFSIVTWASGKTHGCHADLLFHVTSITLTCAFKPLLYFIVCPHFRSTLGSLCGTKKKPKESFGTPSFDRISSRILSVQDLDVSRDSRDSRESRDSRGSYFDIPMSTEL